MSKAAITIHGFLTVKEDFGRLYDYLDFYDEVKAVELPGHNGDKPNFSLFTTKATFKAVLDAYEQLASKYDCVDVIGFSMGGALATWLASVRKVDKLVLVSPANRYINASLPIAFGKFFSELGWRAFRETDGKLKDKFDATGKAFSPYVENIHTANKIAKERTFRYMTPRTFTTFRSIVKNCNAVVESTSPNATPTLILWGKLDELVPERSVKYLINHFTAAQATIYPDVGHSMLYTNLDDVIIHDIVKFLTDGEVLLEVPKR